MAKKLRVFEAFAGIGSQVSALKRMGIDYSIVGISEWFMNAILCYDAIHNDNNDVPNVSRNEMLGYLNKLNLSRDSVNLCKTIDRMTDIELKKIYEACKRSNNFGSIVSLNASELPDMDLIVYSFPCQDLSTGGTRTGMKRGSGTRSGLLWELERILTVLKKENRLPSYLLLENVPTIFSARHVDDLNEWKKFLESLGYHNSENLIINPPKVGIPQRRHRGFLISSRVRKIDVSSLSELADKPHDIRNFLKFNYQDETLKKEADDAHLPATPSRIDMWKKNGIEIHEISEKTRAKTITCSMDRRHSSAIFRYNGHKGDGFRMLTIREAFLLMGFTEEEYEKAKTVNLSYRKMNKLIGNSIVVNVIKEIFEVIYEDFNDDKR